MTYFQITFITALNAILFFFLSFLAAGGDGRSDGIKQLWHWGFSWISAFAVAAIFLCWFRQKILAVSLVTFALPLGFIALQTLQPIKLYFSTRSANSPEFDSSCKRAGARFFSSPSAPVRSIAYDWSLKFPPKSHYYSIDDRGNLEPYIPRSSAWPYPSDIEYIESRCCRDTGAPVNRVGPYIRWQPEIEFFGITDLTADVLVLYDSAPIGPQSTASNLQQFTVTVKDQRDGRALAEWIYLVDEIKLRGCGAVSGHRLNEREFILKALGLSSD
jgi:hypothetical protein